MTRFKWTHAAVVQMSVLIYYKAAAALHSPVLLGFFKEKVLSTE